MPPPSLLILVAFGAGLATGLLHFMVPGVAILLPVIVLAWKSRPMLATCAAVALLGVMAGSLEIARERRSCERSLTRGRVTIPVAMVETAGGVGGVVPVRPLRAGCEGSVRARWPAHARGAPGDQWRVEGSWHPAREGGMGRGTLVVRTATPQPGAPTLGDRVRGFVLSTSERLYGSRAGLVDALVLNRRSTMDPALSEAYARSGLVHILSISGFHVGLIAGWLYLLARLARMGRTRAMVTSAALSTLYVAFLGWPAPATRAAALVMLVAVCRWRQRQVEPDALLAATCLAVLIVDPSAVFDLGAWLSASALWGATRFSRWSDRALGAAVGWRTLASSVGATLATAPITAAFLGSVALAGIVLNFAAIPIAAIAVPGVLASILLDPLVPGLAAAIAAGAGAALGLMDGIAMLGGGFPVGHLVSAAELRSGLPWAALLGFMVWSMGRRNTASVAMVRWCAGLAVAVWASLGWILAPAGRDSGSELTLHFLRVGQGDGAAIRTPGGQWVIVDAGPRFDGADAGARVVVPFLRRQGARRLAAAFVSHAHADHLGGMPAVLERFPAGVVIEPGDYTGDPRYLEFLGLLEGAGIRWHPGRPGDRFMIDSVSFTVLHPDTTWSEWGTDLNEDSIVLLVEYGGFQALFTGDAGERAEARFARATPAVDLLKVGHHGSRTATGAAFLERTRPRAAVISSGTNNYGHPSREVLARLAARDVETWRTDQDGPVRVRTDGRTMTICADRGCRRYPVTGPNVPSTSE